MDIEQALAIVNQATYAQVGRYLSDIEQLIFTGAWQGQTYEQIAEAHGYSVKYLKDDSGRKFWKLLSLVFDESVSKTNFRAAVERLGQRQKRQQTNDDQSPPSKVGVTNQPHASNVQADWGEVIDVSQFYGRSAELTTLMQWIMSDRCRVIALLGMGGIGKTALSVKLANQLLINSSIRGSNEFALVIWRSLRNAPPLDTLLADVVPFLSNQQDTRNTLHCLLHHLRSRCCLVILDNMETILQGGEQAGQFRARYEGYGELLRMVSESSHQSCVIITSREKPAEVAAFEGMDSKIRSLQLGGSEPAAQAILQAKGLIGSSEQQQELCNRYSNSPLAIKIVSTSIQDLFEGDIDEFLKQDTTIFNGIRRLLDQQFDRLSPLEQTIMYWLAINREWTTIAELHRDIIPAVSKAKLLESLESLSWRSLIEKAKPTLVEKQSGGYTQQPVVMEYVTERLIEQTVAELAGAKPHLFLSYALIKTTVKDYVRESQVRLILQPIALELCKTFRSTASLEQQVLRILIELRRSETQASGYGAGNLINLCAHLKFDLTGFNFANLTIRHAYLQKVTLHRVHFAHANFIQSIFTQTFGSVLSIAFDVNGMQLATGSTDGSVCLWGTADGQPISVLKGHTNWVRCVQFSPAQAPELQRHSGELLASASQDRTIRLWNPQTGQCLNTLRGHTAWVWSISWSPDGQTLASGSYQIMECSNWRLPQNLAGAYQHGILSRLE
jgi:hypothetical protein